MIFRARSSRRVTPDGAPGVAEAMRTIVVHYHLFKNAGSSLDRTLRENFGAGWTQREDVDGRPATPQNLAAFLADHPSIVVVSSHSALLPEPVVAGARVLALVFVRHPLDRIRSVYDFEHRQGAETQGARAAKELDIVGYVDWRLQRAADLGDHSVADFQTSRLARGTPQGGSLARALATIARLPFIGFVEEYERSLERLEAVLAPAFPHVRLRTYRDNTTLPTPTSLDERLAALRERIGPERYARLEAANENDLVIWETVRAMYAPPAARPPAERTSS